MRAIPHFALILHLSLLAAPGVLAAEPEVADKDMPRFPAVDPKDAIATFKVRPGFAMQLAAAEPLVQSPVAIAFDEDARMFIVEMRDYSERRDEKLGRIRLLEDTDGDGVYDKATVYADGLGWPTALFPWDGGVFVGCTPDILYFKDTNGDGKADVRRVVFTGFADGVKRLNVQALLNSFNWGLDNRIHGAASFNGGKVYPFSRDPTGSAHIDLRNKGFNFDPRTNAFAAENGGGQHGLSFDDYGRAYLGSNSHHLQTFAYDARYADRNPAAPMPAALIDIAVDGPAAEVYRISPEEPWRVIRTKWRVNGLASGPIEGGGRSAGYFTGATGATIYRGVAYGPDYLGDAFIGDAGGNLVHRKKILPDGAVVKAQRATDEQRSEFVASTDTWFRPVQFANGPDGCLYVIDMYRETIEHPWSLPDSLKKHLDLNSGADRGRIYRIVPDGFKRPPAVHLGRMTTAGLVNTLAHPNGWHRDTAARLLYQRQDRAAIPLLQKLCNGELKPQADPRCAALGRLHALYALDGLGALTVDHVAAALADTDAHVRRHGVLLSERFLTKNAGPGELTRKLGALTGDATVEVRYQLALTLGLLRDADLATRLATIYRQDPRDRWIAAAVLNSIGSRAIDLFHVLDDHARGPAGADDLLPQLAHAIGARAVGDEVAAVMEAAGARTDPTDMMTLARALGMGQHTAGIPFEAEKGAALIEHATTLVADANADLRARVAAAGLLGCVTWDHSVEALRPLLDPRQPQDLQLAAVQALDQLDRGALAAELLDRWPGMSPKLREAAAAALVKRPARATALLEAVRDGQIQRTQISGSQAVALRQSADPAVRELAAKLLAAPAGRRADVVKAFAPAIDLPGDAKRGHVIYAAKCASCHRFAGEGSALGPDLETVKTMGREKLLVNILDPNREVAPNYAAYAVETTDGDSQVGIIAAETASSVTLKMAYAIEVAIPRDTIKSMRSTGLSMMPEGLEEGMKPQDLADLLEFITANR